MGQEVQPEQDRRLRGLLAYRPWRGEPASPEWSVLPIAKHSIRMMLRRKSFWALYALALLTFFMFFFGQYMLFWAQSQSGQNSVRVMGRRTTPAKLIEIFRERLKLDGTAVTYRTFYSFQGSVVMVLLALAGSLLVGNDFRYGTLPFYLSKPISSRHYLTGKGLAIATILACTTLIPALILYVQYGFLSSYDYFGSNWMLMGGIIGYGLLITTVLTIILLTTSMMLRKTVPLVMTWITLFFFVRRLTRSLVHRLNYDPHWKLFDLWNDVLVCGNYFLGLPHKAASKQPEVWIAGLVLGVVCTCCLLFLVRRAQAVEIVK